MADPYKFRSRVQAPAFALIPSDSGLHPFTGKERLSDRYGYTWMAGERGKPGINADIQNAAESVRMIADPHFEVLGTNADTTTVTHHPEGGIVLTTKTTSADQVIIAPHLDTSQSGWTQTTWGTDRSVIWECLVKTPATITTMTIWLGLKLTNTSTTATDDNQVFFRAQPSVVSGLWQAISSISGTDTATSSGFTLTASTTYHFAIIIRSDRVAEFWINRERVTASGVLTDAIDLIPYIGVETGAAAARALTVYGQAISRATG